jgi:hypothetical protein
MGGSVLQKGVGLGVLLFGFLLAGPVPTGAQDGDQPWVRYEGGEGPGQGKHVVLVSGDEEYRSEEALPMLGKILAVRHGFTCTVLFPIDPETGLIEPDHQTNIPGLEQLEDADLIREYNLEIREATDE